VAHPAETDRATLGMDRTTEPDVQAPHVLEVRGLEIEAGGRVVQSGLSFDVRRGEVLAVVGPSGSGKTTLLRHLVGLASPCAGRVLLHGQDLHAGDDVRLAALRRHFGVMFQSGALWTSMSVAENLLLPLRLFSDLDAGQRAQRVRAKLDLVGMADALDLMPAELSGGMRKRVALARALVLEPELLFLDEPGSGLDPPNAARLDALILQLRRELGTTIVMVTHEVASVLAVADRMLYLDERACTMTALAAPDWLVDHGPPAVRAFLRRQAETGRAMGEAVV
jgi:phospholipid/cholesterol/gamma-HCH transport system ATP-binding protein